ncbi:MAG: guanylate kinase [Acidobacteriota bacterium]|nr:guanylate kinase [Acidobacteriota bacterium]
MNNLIVISGPSGSGKSTLIRRLLQKHREIVFSVSHTTRPRREREIDGKDYYFVTGEQFRQMIDNNEFVEWAQVYGNYYGTGYREIETKGNSGYNQFLALDIDVQGAGNIRKKYPEALFIFVVPPSLEELQNRLLKREKKEDENTRKRLEIARQELKEYEIYDYIVVNKDLDQAFFILNSIYTAYRNTTARREYFIKRLLTGGKE